MVERDDPRIDRLPAWARQHIDELSRQRDSALRICKATLAAQKPTPFHAERIDCLGEEGGPSRNMVYFDAYSIHCTGPGICVEVIPSPDGVKAYFNPIGMGTGRTAIRPVASNVVEFIRTDTNR